MDDIVAETLARIERLQQKAKSKNSERKSAEQNERQHTWQRIKTEAPDVAEFLTAIQATFGKADAVAVKLGDEVVVKRGVFK